MVNLFNTQEDLDWVREVHLKGIDIPERFRDFKSFVITGHESSPVSIDLYEEPVPYWLDDYFSIDFTRTDVRCSVITLKELP